MCIAGRLGKFKYHSSSEINGPWFCPAHYCSICCSLEVSKSKIFAYPLEALSLSLQLNPVDLQQCSTCPFSICFSCLTLITGNRGRKLSKSIEISNGNGNTSIQSSGSLFKNISTQLLKLNGIRSPKYAVMLTQLTKKNTTTRKVM